MQAFCVTVRSSHRGRIVESCQKADADALLHLGIFPARVLYYSRQSCPNRKLRRVTICTMQTSAQPAFEAATHDLQGWRRGKRAVIYRIIVEPIRCAGRTRRRLPRAPAKRRQEPTMTTLQPRSAGRAFEKAREKEEGLDRGVPEVLTKAVTELETPEATACVTRYLGKQHLPIERVPFQIRSAFSEPTMPHSDGNNRPGGQMGAAGCSA